MRPGDHAVYEIGPEGSRVRCFMCTADARKAGMSALEREADKVVDEGFSRPEHMDPANRTDPYREIEKILAERYGSARMVEAHYDWRPRVRY